MHRAPTQWSISSKSHLAKSSFVALTISFFSRILYLSLGLETPWLGPLGDVLDCTAAHVAIVKTQFLSRFPGVSGRIYSMAGRLHDSPTAINVSDASHVSNNSRFTYTCVYGLQKRGMYLLQSFLIMILPLLAAAIPPVQPKAPQARGITIPISKRSFDPSKSQTLVQNSVL